MALESHCVSETMLGRQRGSDIKLESRRSETAFKSHWGIILYTQLKTGYV